MKKVLFAFVTGLVLTAAAEAAPWALVADVGTSSLYVVDLGANPPRAYGPFLQGLLGGVTGLFDIAQTPDGRYALVSNYNGQTIYKVDLADPLNPIMVGALRIDEMGTEDIAVSRDGKVAIVSDGGGSTDLVFISIQSFDRYALYALQTAGATAEAVDIGSDGTVYVADYDNDRLIYGKMNATGTGLISEQWIGTSDAPTNVSVSPDGATVLVPCARAGQILAFRPGAVALAPAGIVSVKGYPQSIAFASDGSTAYVGTTEYAGDRFYRLSVSASGALAQTGQTDLLTKDEGWFYGVDAISVSPDGAFAVVGHMTSWVYGSYLNVQIVRLADLSVSMVAMNGVPVGTSCFETPACAPVDVKLARLANDYIFYKELINRLTWQADAANTSPIVEYRIYRKKKTEPDAAFALAGTALPEATQYDDRNLDKSTAYVYRLTAVNARGSVSVPVEVGN